MALSMGSAGVYELVVGWQRPKKGSILMSKARRFQRSPKKRLRREELLQMETNEQAQREHYQEVERALVKLVEEIEEVKDGDLKAIEQKIYKGVLELGRKLFQ